MQNVLSTGVFHLLKYMFCIVPAGFEGNLVLDIYVILSGGLQQMEALICRGIQFGGPHLSLQRGACG